MNNQTTNRIREEFLEFIEKNKIPWGQNAKTESIIITDFFLSKIAELLKSQKESWVEKIEKLGSIKYPESDTLISREEVISLIKEDNI